MERRPYALLATVLLACGPNEGADASIGLDAGSPDAGSPEAGTADGALPSWIDVHTHCGVTSACAEVEGCCSLDSWQAVRERFGGEGAVLLSTEHYAVMQRVGDLTGDEATLVENLNEIHADGVARDPSLMLFPSLECWYDTPFDDPGWVDACRADVDRWIAAGARGFKDHIGKQFDGSGRDVARWLGGWNRLNGFCDVSADSVEPNRDCMAQPTVRYPALEGRWREVLRYILEDVRVPVLSHTISWGGDDPCFDPMTGTLAACPGVTRRHLLELARWAEANLSLSARRRLIVGHLGFLLSSAEDLDRFVALLDTGVSTETAANLGTLAAAGCGARRLFARYGDQLMFGTDRQSGEGPCGLRTYEAWFHSLTARIGEERSFDTCTGLVRATGMELGSATAVGCEFDVPPDTLRGFLRDNFLSLYE